MTDCNITVKAVKTVEDINLVHGSVGAAGIDLPFSTDFMVQKGATIKVGTGIKMSIPSGYVGVIVPRSSNDKLTLANTAGIIDSDYTGEIMLKVKNVSSETFLGYKNDSYFQILFMPVAAVKFMFVNTLEETERGDGGFGSTTGKGKSF